MKHSADSLIDELVALYGKPQLSAVIDKAADADDESVLALLESRQPAALPAFLQQALDDRDDQQPLDPPEDLLTAVFAASPAQHRRSQRLRLIACTSIARSARTAPATHCLRYTTE
jgi:hypothetical protein